MKSTATSSPRTASVIAIVLLLLTCAALAVIAPQTAHADLATGTASSPNLALKEVRSSNGYLTSVQDNASSRYYIVGNVLYKQSNLKSTKLKKLASGSKSNRNVWSISAAYKNTLYLNMSSLYGTTMKTYSYDVKTKKLKLAAGNCTILNRYKNYAVCNTRRTSDVSAQHYVIYKLNGAKLKKVKELGKNTFSLKAIGKHLYYTDSADKSLSKNVVLYRTDFKGAGKKKLGGPWNGNAYTWSKTIRGQVLVSDITKKNCTVMISGSKTKHYRYTYKTKKLKLIRSFG